MAYVQVSPAAATRLKDMPCIITRSLLAEYNAKKIHENIHQELYTIYINSVPVIEYKSGTDGVFYSIRLSSRRKYMLNVVQTAVWYFWLL